MYSATRKATRTCIRLLSTSYLLSFIIPFCYQRQGVKRVYAGASNVIQSTWHCRHLLCLLVVSVLSFFHRPQSSSSSELLEREFEKDCILFYPSPITTQHFALHFVLSRTSPSFSFSTATIYIPVQCTARFPSTTTTDATKMSTQWSPRPITSWKNVLRRWTFSPLN